jgi:hypothetical protein
VADVGLEADGVLEYGSQYVHVHVSARSLQDVVQMLPRQLAKLFAAIAEETVTTQRGVSVGSAR